MSIWNYIKRLQIPKYDAISTGEIDSAETLKSVTWPQSIIEVAKYLTLDEDSEYEFNKKISVALDLNVVIS